MDAVKLVTRALIIFGLASLIPHIRDTRRLKDLEAGIQYS